MATKSGVAKVAPKETKIKKDHKKEVEAKVSKAFTIDCSKPVEDKVFNTSNFG